MPNVDDKLWEDMCFALRTADEVLTKHRLWSMDQNPKGVRDLVGSAVLALERHKPIKPTAQADKMRKVLENFEIRGPDNDKFVWIVLHGKGTNGRAAINLGHEKRIVAQVALLFEEDRKETLK